MKYGTKPKFLPDEDPFNPQQRKELDPMFAKETGRFFEARDPYGYKPEGRNVPEGEPEGKGYRRYSNVPSERNREDTTFVADIKPQPPAEVRVDLTSISEDDFRNNLKVQANKVYETDIDTDLDTLTEMALPKIRSKTTEKEYLAEYNRQKERKFKAITAVDAGLKNFREKKEKVLELRGKHIQKQEEERKSAEKQIYAIQKDVVGTQKRLSELKRDYPDETESIKAHEDLLKFQQDELVRLQDKYGLKVEAAETEPTETKKQYGSPEEIRKAFKSGEITREEAKKLLMGFSVQG